MQVSQVHDHVTHAVIGGKETIDFSISNSAEFFNILSSTLYKDQILAVVREVLCNAWDAHIEAGCTDKPVEITLTSTTFTIKDFGKGIHHDDMGLIYGTYGNSTKKNDGKQTGGFGLGCKSPFAYTDHFEVTSSHAGVKTIYNLSKSSAKAMGKPGIIPIASFPTEESGLTVSITISNSDYSRFATLIRQIIYLGDMNMTLNSKDIFKLGFNQDTDKFIVLNSNEYVGPASLVYIRYGNVVYPVDTAAEIADEYNKVLDIINRVNLHGYKRNSIIFQAPPHSISVTPSRESLSMQEHTIETLKALFVDFIHTEASEFTAACDVYTDTSIKTAVDKKDIASLLQVAKQLPFSFEEAEVQTSVIKNFTTLAQVYMQRHYPKSMNYRNADITKRLTLMAQAGMVDKGKVHTFIKGVKDPNNKWLQQYIIAPVIKKLLKANINPKKLYAFDPLLTLSKSYGRDSTSLIPAANAKSDFILESTPYLRNIIVIASKRTDLASNILNHEALKGLGNYLGLLVYMVGRKAGEAEEVRKHFNASGMRVIDLTLIKTPVTKIQKTPDEIEYAKELRKSKKGLICLSSLAAPGGMNLRRENDTDAVRIENPKYIINFPHNHPTTHLDAWSRAATKIIIEKYGAECGVTRNLATYNKWVNKGAKPLEKHVIEEVYEYMYLNSSIREYWANSYFSIRQDIDHNEEMLNLIQEIPEFKKEFGIECLLTPEEEEFLQLWTDIQNMYHSRHSGINRKITSWLNNIPLSLKAQTLADKLQHNPLLKCVNLREIGYRLKDPDEDDYQKIIKFLITVVNS